MKIDKKQRNLMLNSQVIQEYPWLFNLLKENEKIEIELVPDEHKIEYRDIVPHLIKQCGEEWRGDESVLHPIEDLGNDRRPCSLCGTPNRYIYYIKNRMNGNSLNVGGDCVEDFVDIDFLREGKSKGQLLKEAKRIRRLSIINKEIPRIEKIIDSWENEIIRYDLLIPNSIEQPYIKIGNRIKELFIKYLSEEYDESIFMDIINLLNESKTYISKMNYYQQDNQENMFIATAKMGKWLKEKRDNQTYEWLKEDGVITIKSISRVFEPDFIEKIYFDIKNMLNTIEIDTIGYDHEKKGFILLPNHKDNNDIKILCTYEKFLNYYGKKLFNERPNVAFSLSNIVKISDIFEEKSTTNLIIKIQHVIKSSSIGISIHDDYLNMNEIDLLDKHTNLILPYDLQKFIYEFKGLAFNLANPSIKELENYVRELPGKRYTKNELRQIRSERERMGI